MFDFDFLSMKKSVDSLQQRRDALSEQLTKNDSLLSQTRHASINKADMPEIVDQWVKKSSTGFAKSVAEYMTRNRHGTAEVGFFSLVTNESGEISTRSMDGVMCAVFGDQIKKSILSAIADMEWPSEGLPKAKRAAEIERLEKVSQNLRVELEELVQKAHELGIQIQ